MRIGDLVKDHIGKIFRHCEGDPIELVRLMSAEYSRRTFGLAYPFAQMPTCSRQKITADIGLSVTWSAISG